MRNDYCGFNQSINQQLLCLTDTCAFRWIYFSLCIYTFMAKEAHNNIGAMANMHVHVIPLQCHTLL